MGALLTPSGGSRPWRRLRLMVLDRDRYRCQLPVADGSVCGAPASHVDHIVPRKDGGTDDPSNLRAACPPCNLRRGAGRPPTDPSRPGRRKPSRSAAPWRRLRQSVLDRDRGLCQWPTSQDGSPCLAPATTVVHVILPSSGGRRDDPANLRATCAACATLSYRRAAHAGNDPRRVARQARGQSWSW